MKKFILLLICLCITENCFAEKAILRGLVVLQNSNGQSVSGAQISAFDANAQTSDSSGRFELVFAANKKAGDKVVLSVQKQGLEVVNRKELDVIIPANPDDVVKIVMCKQGERDKHALQYYEIAKDTINRSYEEQLKLVNEKYEKSLKEKNEAIKALKAQKEAGLSQAKDLADKFAEVNLDDASELYKEAFALFQKGEVDKAIQVLEDEKMDKLLKTAQEEKRKAQERLAKSEEAVRKSIDNYILKARMCKSRFQFDDAEKNYRKAVEGDSENFENVFEFALYFQEQNKHLKAISLYEKILSLPIHGIMAANLNVVLNNLGILYKMNNQYNKAEETFNLALNISEELAKQNPETYLSDLAMTLNNLGILYRDIERYDDAEKVYNRALEIYEKLAKQNPEIYLPYVASLLNNFGNLYANNERYSDAEKLYNRALEIREELAKQNPDAYLHYLSEILNNLGVLYQNSVRYGEAEKAFNRTLEIREKLAKQNPDAYSPYLGIAIHNLANLYAKNKRYEEAEKAFNRALEIYEKLAKQNPRVFEIKLCIILTNLSCLQADIFEKELKESYRSKGLSYAKRAILILHQYLDVPIAKDYMKKALFLKIRFENSSVSEP